MCRPPGPSWLNLSLHYSLMDKLDVGEQVLPLSEVLWTVATIEKPLHQINCVHRSFHVPLFTFELHSTIIIFAGEKPFLQMTRGHTFIHILAPKVLLTPLYLIISNNWPTINSGAAVPFWWWSRVRAEKMVFMALVNYQNTLPPPPPPPLENFESCNIIFYCQKMAMIWVRDPPGHV